MKNLGVFKVYIDTTQKVITFSEVIANGYQATSSSNDEGFHFAAVDNYDRYSAPMHLIDKDVLYAHPQAQPAVIPIGTLPDGAPQVIPGIFDWGVIKIPY